MHPVARNPREYNQHIERQISVLVNCSDDASVMDRIVLGRLNFDVMFAGG